MRRSALQTFFRSALVAAIPLSLGVAQATTPACTGTTIVIPSLNDDGGVSITPINGTYTTAQCNQICGGYGYYCEPASADAGPTGSVACHINRCSGNICGRMTDGVECANPGHRDEVVRFLENAADLEAASVWSFDRLARELTAHGALPSLIARARAAGADEVRHARVVGALAKRRGGRGAKVATPSLPVRTLADVAVENVVEGCVRETYGALVGGWQARTAAARDVNRAMRAIARDEQRHAELAWDVARWTVPRLSPTERRRVRDAMRETVAGLARDVELPPSQRIVRELGVPEPAVARALVADGRRRLWRA